MNRKFLIKCIRSIENRLKNLGSREFRFDSKLENIISNLFILIVEILEALPDSLIKGWLMCFVPMVVNSIVRFHKGDKIGFRYFTVFINIINANGAISTIR